MLERIEKLLYERDMTIAGLERKMNFGNGTVRRWDFTSPSTERLMKVAEFLGVSLDYLVYGEKAPSKIEMLISGMGELTELETDMIEAVLEALLKRRENESQDKQS